MNPLIQTLVDSFKEKYESCYGHGSFDRDFQYKGSSDVYALLNLEYSKLLKVAFHFENVGGKLVISAIQGAPPHKKLYSGPWKGQETFDAIFDAIIECYNALGTGAVKEYSKFRHSEEWVNRDLEANETPRDKILGHLNWVLGFLTANNPGYTENQFYAIVAEIKGAINTAKSLEEQTK